MDEQNVLKMQQRKDFLIKQKPSGERTRRTR